MKKKIILFFFLFIFFIDTGSALEMYTNKGQSFKIGYPSGWNVFENYGGVDLYLTDPYSYAAVSVKAMPTYGMSLTQIKDLNKMAFYQMGYYPYNEWDITINNLKGFEWRITFTNYYTYVVYEEWYLNLISGNKYYIITASSPQSYYSEYSNIFSEIINSFEILTEPALTPKITTPLITPTIPLTPAETVPMKTPTPVEITSKPSASVQLHGQKTDVVLGEDIVLKLSAVNIITKPVMTVQVILLPPSGMSVTSADFVQVGPGQYTSTYKLDPGSGRNIEVRLQTNQIGDFEVKGRVVYYYGDDKSTAEDYELLLPIKVRAEAAKTPQTPQPQNDSSSSAIVGVIAILVVIFAVYVIFNKLFKAKSKPEVQPTAPMPIGSGEEIKPSVKESTFEDERRNK